MNKDYQSIHNQLVGTIRMARLNYLMIGQSLIALKKDDNFQKVHGEGNWFNYISQPEIGFTNHEYKKVKEVLDTFDESYFNTLTEIPFRHLHLLTKSEDPIGLLDDALVLSYKDLKERVVDVKKETANEPNTRTHKYVVMRKCVETGTLNKVYDVESEEIENKFNLNDDGIRKQ